MENQVLDYDLQIAKDGTQREMAGFWIRVGATLIDVCAYLPLIGLNMYNLYILKSFPLEIIIFLILTIYKPFMEFKYGATLGKMAVKIKVVNHDFGNITISQAILRYTPWMLSQIISITTSVLLFQDPNFISARGMIEVTAIQKVVISPVFNILSSVILLISCVMVGLNDKKQGGHDMIAGTYCIYNDGSNATVMDNIKKNKGIEAMETVEEESERLRRRQEKEDPSRFMPK